MSNYDIKTIIFDLGGVIFTSGTTLAMKKIATNYDISHIRVSRVFKDKEKKLGYELRAGLITMDQFLERTIKKLGLDKEYKEHIKFIWFNSYIPHYGMFELLDALTKNYYLIVFSGNVEERVKFLDKRYDFLKYFDDCVFSYDCHKNKNQIEFYQELVKHLKCKPEDALLIDDDKRAIIISNAMGLNTITYYYPSKLIKDLREFNIKIDEATVE